MRSIPVVIMNINPRCFVLSCDELDRSINLTRILKIITEFIACWMHQVSYPWKTSEFELPEIMTVIWLVMLRELLLILRTKLDPRRCTVGKY
jgi:hypothetical protein